MSYLVAFQLKKMLKQIAECTTEEVDSSGIKRMILRGLPPSSVIKFNNFFKQNLVNLLAEEAARDPYCRSSFDAPKYSVCFMDLAEYLDLKDDVYSKLEEMQEQDTVTNEDPLVFSARTEREKQILTRSTPGFTQGRDDTTNKSTQKMQKLASNHLARQA